ncbi:MAG: exopolysaccharide biosynthesis polyprenyl glycosylphosphotransferase [Conexibacter sp.]|nr:exopolysaccharide biosynthesis polyprenyl glycosylphosphotransferase [Conexibacter sp.]
MSSVRGSTMSKWTIAQPIVVAAACWVTVAAACWQIWDGSASLAVDVAVALMWVVTLSVSSWRRRRRLRELVAMPPRPLGSLSITDFMHDADSQRVPVDADAVKATASLLGARRLVLLTGDSQSFWAEQAWQALQSVADLRAYALVVPARRKSDDLPPLTTLLTSKVLGFWGRQVLWLGDISGLMAAGFDPRLVERWLALGRGRAAVAFVSDTDLARINGQQSQQGLALRRAATVRVPARRRSQEALDRYLDLVADDAEGAAIVRIVARCELLGNADLPEEDVVALARRLVRPGLDESVFDRLVAGENSPLLRTERGRLAADYAIVGALDGEPMDGFDTALIDALRDRVAPHRLLRLGQALMLRHRLDAASAVLESALTLARNELKRDVERTLVILEQRRRDAGMGSVSLLMPGGYDFLELMGPSQRERARQRLGDAAPNGIFDPSLPSATDSRAARFYRLTMYRAAVRALTLVLIDAAALMTAAVPALAIRASSQPDQHPHWIDGDFWKLVGSSLAVTVVIAVTLGLYRPAAARARPQLILVTMALMTVAVAAGFFVAHVNAGSVAALGVLLATAFAADCVYRYAYDRISRYWVAKKRLEPRVLLLGSQAETHRWAEAFAVRRGRPVQIVAYAAERRETADPYCVGSYDELEVLIDDLHIAELVIVDRDLDTSEKASYISRAHTRGVTVSFAASDHEVVLGAAGTIGDRGLVVVPAVLLSQESLQLKRLVDCLLVAATLPVWAATLVLYGAYSKLRRPGQPVFVSEDRVGLGQTVFPMLRLRTRKVHDDGERSRGAMASGRVEHFMESTGLDELPQVINVLRGEMSVVGPRPLAAEDAFGLSVDQQRTLGARPGMTGRWQVFFPYLLAEEEMRAMDADYLRRWRISHDIDLILRTPVVIALRRIHAGDTEIGRRRTAVARATG